MPATTALSGIAVLTATAAAVSLGQSPGQGDPSTVPDAAAQPSLADYSTGTSPALVSHPSAKPRTDDSVAGPQEGPYVGTDDTGPYQRVTTGQERLSRSGVRTAAAAPPASPLMRRAERAAAARERQLAKTTVSAEDLAKEIEAERRRERRLARKRAREAAMGWAEPTSGYEVTTWFGEAGSVWSSGYHTGIDMATGCGVPVTAVDDGVITEAGYGVGGWAYGNQVRVQFENGDEVWYNHLSSISVSSGQTVSKGESLGAVGDTGNSYGCHLHFEYREASNLETAVDPLPYLEDNGISLR